jgi:Ca2+-binding EF-hand superfamily protein
MTVHDVPLKPLRAVPSTLLIASLCVALAKHLLFCEDPPVEHNETAALVMAAVATFFNTGVVFYHLTTPAHPKFRLIRKRRLCLQAHVASGVVEITTCCLALYDWRISGKPASHVSHHARVAWMAGIVHAFTGLYQTHLVFGCKLIMRPAYYVCGLFHLMSALATRDDLENPHRVLSQYLILCIFTWCRVYIALFSAINFATQIVYSLSIALAGITIMPHVLGPLGPLYFAAVLAISAYAWAWSADITFDSPEWAEITAEHVRAQLFDHYAMDEWKGLSKDATVEESDAAALKAFQAMDQDKSGYLDRSEVVDLLTHVKIDMTVRHAMLAALERLDNKVDFETFLNMVWNIGERDPRQQRTGRLDRFYGIDLAKVSMRDKARAVFDCIDLDKSGSLEVFELTELLTGWGCPTHEVIQYMKKFDEDGNGRITFDEEFFPFMQEIWHFGWDYVLLPKIQEAQRQKGLHSVVEFERFKELRHERKKTK